MPTAKQIQANRKNAQKSTGPRTEAGKEASSQNAVVHGLTAEHHLIDGEDPECFQRLLTDLVAEHEPGTPTEAELVHRKACLLWRLRRVPAIEAAVFTSLTYPQDTSTSAATPRLAAPANNGRSPVPATSRRMTIGQALEAALSRNFFEKISRYEVCLMKQLFATEEQLIQLSYQRKEQAIARAAATRNQPAPIIDAGTAFAQIKLG